MICCQVYSFLLNFLADSNFKKLILFGKGMKHNMLRVSIFSYCHLSNNCPGPWAQKKKKKKMKIYEEWERQVIITFKKIELKFT